MPWGISETSLSPTYYDEPVEYWESPDVEEHEFGNNYPWLGEATAELLKALDEATEVVEADGEMGPLPDLPENYYLKVAKQVLRDYGLTVHSYMDELTRRVGSNWIHRAGLWSLDPEDLYK